MYHCKIKNIHYSALTLKYNNILILTYNLNFYHIYTYFSTIAVTKAIMCLDNTFNDDRHETTNLFRASKKNYLFL